MANRLHRLGGWAFEHRWRVVAIWVTVLVAVLASAMAFGGKTNDKFSVPGTESQQAQELLEKKYPAASGTYARLVPGIGIADTVGLAAGHDSGSMGGVIPFNPYAAMPSMHVGWSLLVGIFGFRALRSNPLRWLFALHPVVMAIAVTATGNHYFLDSAAGVVVVLTALTAIRVFNRKER